MSHSSLWFQVKPNLNYPLGILIQLDWLLSFPYCTRQFGFSNKPVHSQAAGEWAPYLVGEAGPCLVVVLAVWNNGKHRAKIQMPSQKLKIRNTKLKSKPKSVLRTQTKGQSVSQNQGREARAKLKQAGIKAGARAGKRTGSRQQKQEQVKGSCRCGMHWASIVLLQLQDWVNRLLASLIRRHDCLEKDYLEKVHWAQLSSLGCLMTSCAPDFTVWARESFFVPSHAPLVPRNVSSPSADALYLIGTVEKLLPLELQFKSTLSVR